MTDDLRLRLAGPVHSGSVEELYQSVEAETHHGRPGVNAATKRWIARELRRRFGKQSEDLLELAGEMSRTDSVTLRSVATIVLREFWSSDHDPVMGLAMTLANDDHWEVREWAASLWASYLDGSFEQAYPTVLRLTSHPEVNIRRSMALAAMGAADRKKPERAGPLLAIIERLLVDPAPYVKKNLGPFAVGAGLLRVYPAQTLDAINAWATREDPMTRWNVAMVASSARAAKHTDRLLPVLELLAQDERRAVQMAVRSALRTLCKRVPEACEPTLERLASDPATRDIAGYARADLTR